MVECENLVTNWYESLNANQRDPRRVDNEDAKHFLESLATHSNQFDTKIVKLLPKKIWIWDCSGLDITTH